MVGQAPEEASDSPVIPTGRNRFDGGFRASIEPKVTPALGPFFLSHAVLPHEGFPLRSRIYAQHTMSA